jgi:UDP-N-acetyl-D-mannosaminuronic acid dehydrogenase
MSKIAVVGGCGRLGLRIALIAANRNHNVTCIDIDDERINEISQGCLPFVELNAEDYLEKAIKDKTLTVTMEYEPVNSADVVIISIGTPVDSNLNPSLEPVAGVIFDLAEHFKKDQLIVFRNILSPQIIGRIKTLLEEKTKLKVGKDIFLAFAPEISNDNFTINDISNNPQPVGAYDKQSFKLAETFFQTITKGKISFVTPEEALLGKLMLNMYSYVQAACANEFYLIAEGFGANMHKILDSCQTKENNIPNPHASKSGPGMHKEGWFLLEKIPFAELITTSFKINESMASYIIQKIQNVKASKVAILGMTSKANSDEIRASLGYKIRKALCYQDYEVVCYDPYLPEYSDSSVLKNVDVVILMTPHDAFKDLDHIKQIIRNPNCAFVDINGFWKELRGNTKTGGFHHVYYSK